MYALAIETGGQLVLGRFESFREKETSDSANTASYFYCPSSSHLPNKQRPRPIETNGSFDS